MTKEELNDSLSKAVINGNIPLLHELLEQGADLHMVTPKGVSLLGVAANRKKRAMFEELVNLEQNGKKINLDNTDSGGFTLMLTAVKEGEMTYYLQRLLELGANPNIPSNDGMTPLIKAIADGKKDEFTILLNSPATDVNYAIDGTKTTAFLMATTASAGSDSLEMCKELLDKGADVNAKDINGKNALINALFRTKQFMKKREKNDLKELCKFLIDQNIDLNYVAPSGMSAFWMAANELASRDGDAELATIMLDRNVNTDVWHSIGLEGRTSALHAIAHAMGEKVDVEFVKKVISLGANINAPDEDGNTPAAFGFMNPEAREITLELGGDVNAILYQKDAKKKIIKTPIISIVTSGGTEQLPIIEEMVRRGAKITFQDDPSLKDKEPIVIAIGASADKVVDLFLQSGKIDPNTKIKTTVNSQEISLLSYIVNETVSKEFTKILSQKNQLKALKKAQELNEKNGVVSPLIDDEGFKQIDEQLKAIAQLEESLQENRKFMFDSLLSHGADVNLLNEHEESAIYFASSPTTMQWLIDAGVDLFIKNKDGDDVLIDAIKNNKSEIIPFLVEKFKEVNHSTIQDVCYQLAFAEVKGAYQRQNIEGGVLNLLSDEDKPKMTQKLIPNPDPSAANTSKRMILAPEEPINLDNINYQDADGNSPILVACANDNAFLVSLYRRLGGDINLANNNGETPLMHAIASGNHKLVDFLVDQKADVEAKTNEGKTILDFATEIENKAILEKVKIALGHGIIEGQLTGVKKYRM